MSRLATQGFGLLAGGRASKNLTFSLLLKTGVLLKIGVQYFSQPFVCITRTRLFLQSPAPAFAAAHLRQPLRLPSAPVPPPGRPLPRVALPLSPNAAAAQTMSAFSHAPAPPRGISSRRRRRGRAPQANGPQPPQQPLSATALRSLHKERSAPPPIVRPLRALWGLLPPPPSLPPPPLLPLLLLLLLLVPAALPSSLSAAAEASSLASPAADAPRVTSVEIDGRVADVAQGPVSLALSGEEGSATLRFSVCFSLLLAVLCVCVCVCVSVSVRV